MERVAITPTRRRDFESTVEEKKEPSGLCSCCRFAEHCTYPKDPSQPILQCDEFEGLGPPPPALGDRKNLQGIVDEPLSSSEKDFKEFKGLCTICENRPTCTFPKPEGGVWHCEEYR